ncbi:MAG: bifunctional nuclease domain-containing protein, partial [Fidelibacterota bacterium]
VLDIQSKKIGHREIDSRPSDALALALRMHAPIFVSTDIMDEAIILEKDLQNIEDEIKQEPMIETLEKQLQKAIQEEEYEVAARIRDKIKNI